MAQTPFTKKQRRELRKKQQREEQKSKDQKKKIRQIIIYSGIGISVFLGTAVIGWIISKQPIFPPTSAEGHVEQSPPSHILNKPMDSLVFRHMLEHADGSGQPGIIISYNCEDFECEAGFLDRLKQIVNKYPSFVYLAPYNKMSVRLVITKHGEQKIFDVIDENKIQSFIEQ